MWFDQLLSDFYKRISERVKRVFAFSLFWNVISHLYMMTNLLYNHDGAVSMYSNTDGLQSGRWFLKFATSLSGSMQMPVVIVFFSMIYLTILCCAVVEVLEITSSWHMFIVSGLIITFPTVAGTFSYLFTADAYFLSAMLSVLAVYFTVRRKKGWICSVILLAFATGIYQAYMSFAAGMFVILVLLMILDADRKFRDVITEGLKYISVLMLGMGLYYVILQLLLKANHVSLCGYRGIDQMGKYSLGEIPGLLATTYKEIIDFYFIKGTISYIPDYLVTTNRIILCFMIVIFIGLCVRRRIYLDIKRMLLALLLAIICPLALNCMQLLNTQDKPHTLMIFSYLLFYLMFIKLVELVSKEIHHVSFNHVIVGVCNLLCIVILYRGYIFTNESYLRLQLTYESTYSFATRLAASIEKSEYYDAETPVLIGGHFNYTEYPFRRFEFDEMSELTGIFSDYIFYDNWQLNQFLAHTLNLSYIWPEPQIAEEIKGSDEYKNMRCYPHEDSIRRIKGVLVVKLSDD